jgi:hypothetical protein
MSDKVTLLVAWSWECPKCGKKYFTNGQRLNDPETMEQARLAWGEDCPEYVVCAPDSVHCVRCQLTFETVDTEDDG